MNNKQMDMQQEAAMAFADIKDSYKTGRVLYAQAIGIEYLGQGNMRKECLKLDYKGVYGYLPKELIDNYEFKGLQSFIGKVFEFVVNHVDLDNHIFGADRIQALERLAERFWVTAKEGQQVEAFVRGIDPYNVYLLVEGVPVKLHRDDFSYTFYEDLREVVEIGDPLDVVITSVVKPEVVDDEKIEGRIEVSRKNLEVDPWDYIDEYKEKSTYLGVIKRVHMDHGLFVDLLPRNIRVRANFPPNTNQALLKEGQQVNVKIQQINVEKRSIKVIIITPRQNILKQKTQTTRRGLLNNE